MVSSKKMWRAFCDYMARDHGWEFAGGVLVSPRFNIGAVMKGGAIQLLRRDSKGQYRVMHVIHTYKLDYDMLTGRTNWYGIVAPAKPSSLGVARRMDEGRG